MIPVDLLDQKYDIQQPIQAVPALGDKWGAFTGQAVAEMPTTRTFNALSRLDTEPKVSPDELNKSFPPIGSLSFTEPMSYSSAQDLYQDRQAEAKRQDILSRSDFTGVLNTIGTTAIRVGTTLGDPITDIAFAATDGLAGFAAAPLARGIGAIAGGGMIGKAALAATKFGVHGAIAGIPLTGLNAVVNKAEGKDYTFENAIEEETNLALGGAGLGLVGGAGLAFLQKAGLFAKVGEEMFSKLKPQEKEALVNNRIAQLQGGGLTDKELAGLSDTVVTNEFKIGLEAKTGEQQAHLVKELEVAPEDLAQETSDGIVQKKYTVKNLNSDEVKKIHYSTGDEDFLNISNDKWEAEKRYLDKAALPSEELVSRGKGNPIIERYLSEKYPELGIQPSDELAIHDAYSQQNPSQVLRDLTENRQAQINQTQTERLQNLSESMKNGSFEQSSPPDKIAETHQASPTFEQHEVIDQQIKQIDELQKNLEETQSQLRGVKEELPSNKSLEGDTKSIALDQTEEIMRHQGKFQFLKTGLDCFLRSI